VQQCCSTNTAQKGCSKDKRQESVPCALQSAAMHGCRRGNGTARVSHSRSRSLCALRHSRNALVTQCGSRQQQAAHLPGHAAAILICWPAQCPLSARRPSGARIALRVYVRAFLRSAQSQVMTVQRQREADYLCLQRLTHERRWQPARHPAQWQHKMLWHYCARAFCHYCCDAAAHTHWCF
jgi:hypothetical protein